MRTRPASIATIVVALGLALTTIGITHGIPYTFGGHGDVSAIRADLWAHGTALSPAIVALVFLGLFAVIATRPTRGGRRSALWLAILAGAMLVAGLAEPAQQQALLFGVVDEATPFVWAFHVGLIALILSAVGETRRRSGETATSATVAEPRLTTGAVAA